MTKWFKGQARKPAGECRTHKATNFCWENLKCSEMTHRLRSMRHTRLVRLGR